MDKALHPDRFSCLSNTANCGKEFAHWFKTFENFLTVLNGEVDKLMVLTNFLSPDIFDLVSECEVHDEAVKVLKKAYVKATNEVYARHLLSVRKKKKERVWMSISSL